MVYFHCRKIKAIQVVNAGCFVVKFVFSVFIFSMPSKVIIIILNRVYVLGYKYVLGPFFAARAKMSLSRAQNIFMHANINSIVL